MPYLALAIHISTHTFDGQTVIYNETTRDVVELQDVASDFLNQVDGSRSLVQIADILAQEYDVSREVVLSDLSTLVEELEEDGLLVSSSSMFEGLMQNGL